MFLSKLLLVTEGTEFDLGAERVALALAARTRARLRVVIPLISNPEYEQAAPAHAARAEAEALASFERVAQAAASVKIDCDRAIRRGGDPAQTILQEARRVGPDLIVARRRGKRGFLAKLLVGEMVSTLARQAPCPVLLVPQRSALWTSRILAAPSVWPRDRELLETACALAQDCTPPRLAVCALGASAGPARDAAMALTAERSIALDWFDDCSDTPGDLSRRASACGAELIVLSREPSGAGSAERLTGLPLEVTGEVECPVMLWPATTPRQVEIGR